MYYDAISLHIDAVAGPENSDTWHISHRVLGPSFLWLFSTIRGKGTWPYLSATEMHRIKCIYMMITEVYIF